MRIVAHRGSRWHAPENSRVALISGYTGGADALEFDVQITQDGHLVISHDPTVERLTGQAGVIRGLTLAQLRELNFAATFQPRNSPSFHYFDPNSKRKLVVETLPDLLDYLPEDVELLIELKHDSSLNTGLRDAFVSQAVRTITERVDPGRVVLYSKDPDNLRLARRLAPELRLAAFDFELDPLARFRLMEEVNADGLVTDLESLLDDSGHLTELGAKLEAAFNSGARSLGAILYPKKGVFTKEQYESLSGRAFVWSLSTDSMIEIAPFARPGVELVNERFAGRKVNRDVVALGYAKANKYAEVTQDNGIHIKISEYDGAFPDPPATEVELRLQNLEDDMMYVAKDWPFYSGGGLGLVLGIRGDFAAEVDYKVDNVAQATTLEMAVLNVDPGASQSKPPASFRDKDSFYDPHGAPPYVGVEHDEDDGFRINWNLGSEYDSNQYGKPVGDGKTPRGARLRLERRGPYFSAYYKNAIDADGAPIDPQDWVCVGVVRNDSLNPVVYLRCVGKRWRQEKEDNPTEFMPILPNHFIFKNLILTRFQQKKNNNR
ncbi:MAG TPA: glycerophosphodiester phosphodiesterase family protein [Blastocatellia bacterium]|nr:glycerophosphodiester phosphodiesterase family protein [Blastocatellia bacterium]